MKKLFILAALLFTAKATFASCTASCTHSISYLNVHFTNTSTPPPGIVIAHVNWNFGDGSPIVNTYSPSHTFPSTGSYTVSLVMQWEDSATHTIVCVDSVHDTLTVHHVTGFEGDIERDTALGTVPWDSLWVWLITYDTGTHIIQAIDSQRLAAGSAMFTHYSFTGMAAGNYLVKAASAFGGTGSGFMPTYHTSSLSWSTADYVTVTPYYVYSGKDIYMQYGTLTSGPGFIAGDVTYGAGKGTGIGDPSVGLSIYLVNNTTGKLISATKTDAAGHYSFHVPYGTYTVQPEKAGLLTTAWHSVTVNSSAATEDMVNFKQNSRTIVPVATAVGTVTPLANISVYPNPAHDIVTIAWNGTVKNTADITILNITGQKVYSNTVKVNGANTNINVSALQPGAYFININANEGNYQQKLMVK